MRHVNNRHTSLQNSIFSSPVIYLATFLLGLLLVSFISFYSWYQRIPSGDLVYLWWYWRAFLWAELIGIPEHIVVFNTFQGAIRLQASEVLIDQALFDYVQFYLDKLRAVFFENVIWGALGWMVLSSFIFMESRKGTVYQLLEGVQQASARSHNKYLQKTKQKSHLMLGNAHLVSNAEVQHLFVCGDSGSGKSQLLNQLLEQIRESGDLAVIYDPKGDMVRDFYRPGQDVLYSPFDKRSPRWNVWRDLNDEQDIETFSEAVIKDDPNKDAFWTRSARMVLATAIKKGKQKSLSFSEVLDFIMTSGIDELSEWLKGSEVYSDFSNAKTAANIMSELKTQARGLRHLPELKDPKKGFSITAWFGNRFKQMQVLPHKPQPWLFLPVQKKNKVVGRAVMGTVVELISNFILTQPTDRNRRIWLIIDELPSLKKLSALPELLAEGRGYGVAGVIATQNFSQLMEIYGKDGAHALVGLCSSLVAFRNSDPQTAEYLSKRFGKQIRKEIQHSKSFSKGKHTSLNNGSAEHIIERAAVSETEIYTLPDLKAILRCKGVSNPVKIDVDVIHVEAKEPSFCPLNNESAVGQASKKRVFKKNKSALKNWDI